MGEKISGQSWVLAPISFFVSLQFVLRHLDWSLGIKMAVMLGVPALSIIAVPRRRLWWFGLSLVPLLLLYWVVAGGTSATYDTPAGAQIGTERFWIEVINLGMQCTAFVVAYGLRFVTGIAPSSGV